ncbi:MAG: hypothetical protein J5855_08590, partial [Mailhella sp.]|nr:hypothetical protein [Mailhella sp.]
MRRSSWILSVLLMLMPVGFAYGDQDGLPALQVGLEADTPVDANEKDMPDGLVADTAVAAETVPGSYGHALSEQELSVQKLIEEIGNYR